MTSNKTTFIVPPTVLDMEEQKIYHVHINNFAVHINKKELFLNPYGYIFEESQDNNYLPVVKEGKTYIMCYSSIAYIDFSAQKPTDPIPWISIPIVSLPYKEEVEVTPYELWEYHDPLKCVVIVISLIYALQQRNTKNLTSLPLLKKYKKGLMGKIMHIHEQYPIDDAVETLLEMKHNLHLYSQNSFTNIPLLEYEQENVKQYVEKIMLVIEQKLETLAQEKESISMKQSDVIDPNPSPADITKMSNTELKDVGHHFSLSELQKHLDDVVEIGEDFDRAAIIRDLIKEKEQK